MFSIFLLRIFISFTCLSRSGALRLAALSGVKAAAAVHCGLPDELMLRENLRRLIAEGVFEYIVFVHQREIVKIYSGRELIEVCGKEQRNG